MRKNQNIYDSECLAGADVIAHDITARKLAEEALRNLSQFNNEVISGAAEGIVVYDHELRYIVWNPFMESLTGVQACDVLGKSALDVFPHLREQGVDRLLERALTGETVRSQDTPFQSPVMGRSGWVVGTYAPHRNGEGVNIGIIATIQDITERKQVEAEKAKFEAQYQQSQKTESLGRMAGAIAHHFNNKLGVVMGNLEMAMDKLLQGTEPIENLTAAMQAAGNAAEVSSLMLTYLGQAPGKREPLDISEACLPFLPILRAAMPGKVVLETDLPSPGPVISANTNQIQQVLTNLITNAWEAVGEGRGVIRLSIKTVSPAEITAANRFPIGWQSQDSAYTCLEVTDTGCGIADRDIENLFDPFFSSKFTGRGLGLPVILGIVRAHGGVITVESEPDIGSAFRVFFPVSVEEVPRQPYREAQAPEMEGGGTVLLVEDEEMVRTMGKRMLMRLGFTVLEAKDGVEAVEVFRQRQDEIGFVLCDLTMPRMNGWETLAALRKLKPGVPVILASGYDKAHVMAGDHPEWPQVFLGKPYKLKGLRNAIGEALLVSKKK